MFKKKKKKIRALSIICFPKLFQLSLMQLYGEIVPRILLFGD